MLWIDYQYKSLAYAINQRENWINEGKKVYYLIQWGKKIPPFSKFISEWLGEKPKVEKKVWDRETWEKAIKAHNGSSNSVKSIG